MADSEDLSYVHNADLKTTGFGHTLALLGGKYKMLILYALTLNQDPIRYNALKRLLGNISFKTLTNTLRELEADGLVARKEYPQIPPKVEYSLTDLGQSLIPVIDVMCDWGEAHGA
ncbi:winged helix-turn-helix transcriptional regulator [Levilactobacillus bambusae]|uniref:Transcriptional regulator n=1 Tax=Levilactobacillus bambusae TaxID=2024736 RepID=A0A2V1N066_9LACO|nr:helix-turn-helix domain-containing protein [Levilactobacillus bambusae]PWG00413.1 transcriptional regulator [Levilactobacillus bambusae]